MSPRPRYQSGYAMLAALLVGAVAATFALAVVAAVGATQEVSRADASGRRAAAVKSHAVDAVLHVLRWEPALVSGTAESGGEPTRESWAARWEAEPADPASGWPRRALDVTAFFGEARTADRLVLEQRAEPWAMGVTCTGDAEFRASVTVAGSGVYSGGCIRGREHLAFVADGGVLLTGEIPDLVRGEEYPVAGAHAAAGIFAAGTEIHDVRSAGLYPEDGDPHTGDALPQAWLSGPSAEFLVDARFAAEDPGAALSDGVLDLSAVRPASPEEMVTGRCIVLPEDDEIVLEGLASPEAGRLLIVAPGDVVAGRPGVPLELDGGLVVGGRLLVRGGLVLRGPLHAGSLLTQAPVTVSIDAGWRGRLLPGAVRPAIVECGR